MRAVLVDRDFFGGAMMTSRLAQKLLLCGQQRIERGAVGVGYATHRRTPRHASPSNLQRSRDSAPVGIGVDRPVALSDQGIGRYFHEIRS
jgi:hypothetical protein